MLNHIAIVICILLVGCAGSSAEVTNASAREVAKFPTWRLAEAYGNDWKDWGRKDPEIKAELDRRRAFTAKQWAEIDAFEVPVGAPQIQVYATLGSPTSYPAEYADADGKMTVLRFKRYIYGRGDQVWVACFQNEHVISVETR